MKARHPSAAAPPAPGSDIDAMYGLEPVFEPGADASGSADSAPFVTVDCPYCGEPFETRLDLSQGASHYIEDCQICCQPIEFELDVDTAGKLRALRLHRGD